MSAGEARAEFSNEQREMLLKLARDSVAYGLEHHGVMPVKLENFSEPLRAVRATFVTLHLDGELQGCIGTLRAWQPLVEGIVRHAYAAAFEDPRGRELALDDVLRLDIHISVLSTPEPVAFNTEDDVIRQLRPGVDGVIISENGRSGTLLPSVWSSLADPRAFLNHVKLKAGLPESYWSPTIEVKRYTTESFGKE
ncbi:MAG TPA: AmmeMemoRadiSam system protein A [Planctomycetota bacterium]|nr:AmmeMemoRadiSam system protein A [Planctomycetota bacterium]